MCFDSDGDFLDTAGGYVTTLPVTLEIQGVVSTCSTAAGDTTDCITNPRNRRRLSVRQPGEAVFDFVARWFQHAQVVEHNRYSKQRLRDRDTFLSRLLAKPRGQASPSAFGTAS